MSHPTIEQLAYAFELQSRLGMTVENRKFHASAQIGHVHYGYARYKDHDSDMYAQWAAVIQCAKHYYDRHIEETPIDFNDLATTDKHDDAGILIRPEVIIESQFQPIETAPKDGSEVLLFINNKKIGFGRYMTFGWVLRGDTNPDSVFNNDHKPTHWMPFSREPR